MTNKRNVSQTRVLTPEIKNAFIALLNQPENKEKLMALRPEIEAAAAKIVSRKSHPAYDEEKEWASSSPLVLGGVYKGVARFFADFSEFVEIELCEGAFCAVSAEDSNLFKSLKEGDECLVKIIRLPNPSKKENAVGSFSQVNGDEPVLVAEPSKEWLDYQSLLETAAS